MTLLVTGGAGYIGSHCVQRLLDEGRRVVVLDNLSTGFRRLVPTDATFIEGDISDLALVSRLLGEHAIDTVMHFAAHCYVGESMEDPDKYHRNNVLGTQKLLEAMAQAGTKQLVFSSSCTVYGAPRLLPITEDTPQQPISPYGQSKLSGEALLTEAAQTFGLKSVAFRYFNAAGADAQARRGECHDPEPHLLPLLLQVASGRRKQFIIYGTDYPTPDGTCIRDFVHVEDIVTAHLLGLNALREGGGSAVFNLGCERGYSVREVLDTCRRVTGREIPVTEGPRRPGDPPELVASAAKVRKVLGWQPQFDLEAMIQTAWAWEQLHTAKPFI